MHDCRTTESKLIDLVFDELGISEKLRLLAEIESCAGCLNEYRSMTGTLLFFDEAAEESLPDESYWPRHHAALGRSLASLTPRATAPFWKRLFTAKLPVPVPVAAVIALALLVSSALALRSSPRDAAPLASPAQTVAEAPTRLIEVPVFRERVVTRIVYVEKRPRVSGEGRRQVVLGERDDSSPSARSDEEASGQGGFFTRADLTNFRPADEMKIRIIKRNNSEEQFR